VVSLEVISFETLLHNPPLESACRIASQHDEELRCVKVLRRFRPDLTEQRLLISPFRIQHLQHTDLAFPVPGPAQSQADSSGAQCLILRQIFFRIVVDRLKHVGHLAERFDLRVPPWKRGPASSAPTPHNVVASPNGELAPAAVWLMNHDNVECG